MFICKKNRYTLIMNIQFLSKKAFQKIAAGEVVDRPVSVVRELLDNAIDSEADQIKIQIIEGGKKLVQVSDNGCGMSREDVKICHLKHTTSKIKEFDDIYKTLSLGFRGEALNAISIVSEITISSKNKDDVVGYSALVKGGELINEKEVSRNKGTTVQVEHLFYNIPVRQKSLKSEISEFKQIKETFIQKAIPFYNREFQLIHNGKTVYSSLKSPSHIDRIKLFYGEKITKHLFEVNQDFGDFYIMGYLSEPNFFKGSKKFQSCYINNRPIFSPAISHAISKAYEGITPVGQNPVSFLFIQIPPHLVDVNIHPTKREVKLLNEQHIYQGVYHLIKEMIAKSPSLPKIEFKRKVKDSINAYYQKENSSHQPSFLSQKRVYNQSKSFSKPMAVEYSKPENSVEKEREHRILGTLFNTYVLIEHNDDFILLDQHAAHERLQYEKIKTKLTNETIPSQPLLTPFVVDVPPSDTESISLKQDDISQLGFDLEIFGEQSFIVNAIPYFLKFDQAKHVLEKLLDDVIDGKALPKPLIFIDDVLKMKACRSAIKSGDSVSKEELSHLITELLSYPSPFACPHGRPTALRLSKQDIEQLFLRRK